MQGMYRAQADAGMHAWRTGRERCVGYARGIRRVRVCLCAGGCTCMGRAAQARPRSVCYVRGAAGARAQPGHCSPKTFFYYYYF